MLWALSWQLGNTFLRGRGCERCRRGLPAGRSARRANRQCRAHDLAGYRRSTPSWGDPLLPSARLPGLRRHPSSVQNVLNNGFATHGYSTHHPLHAGRPPNAARRLGDSFIVLSRRAGYVISLLFISRGRRHRPQLGSPTTIWTEAGKSMPSTYLSGLVATYQTVPFFPAVD